MPIPTRLRFRHPAVRGALLGALALIFCAPPSYARPESSRPQAPAAPSLLAEVHVTGSTRYNEAEVARAAGLKTGEVITPEQIQDAVNQLAALGVFSRVNFRFSSLGNKITLNLELQDAPVVPVAFDNFPWFTDADLAGAIRGVAPLFENTAPSDGVQLTEMTEALGKLLRDRHLPGTVEHRLLGRPRGPGMMMQFHLEGPEITVESVEFGDALARDSEKLRERRRDLVKKPYSRLALEIFESEQILPLYLAAGHLRVNFGDPQVNFLTPPNQPALTRISLGVPITAGPAFRVAAVNWTGSTAVSPDFLQDLLPLKTGDLADGLKLTAGWQRVEAEYAHRGYLEVKVDPQPQFDDAASTVSYRVAVTEGPQYRMGDLILTGLSAAADRALRAHWALPHGAVFDGAYYDKMLSELAKPNPAIFGTIPLHYTEVGPWLRTNSQTQTTDVLLDFK